MRSVIPGIALSAAAVILAWTTHWLFPALPLLTVAVALGIVVGNIPAFRHALIGRFAPGLRLSARSLLRIGVVLLGLKLSLVDIAGIGWVGIGTTVAIVVLSYLGTIGIARIFGLSSIQSVLIASGFSICGASAIGAMSGAVRAKDEDQAMPIALVTLCGTLAIAVLPLLWHPLGLSDLGFGHWVGASVHDVGQVVATAQVAGPAALAVAITIKLTRVLLLAPMVAVTALVERRRQVNANGKPPKVIPLFVLGFILAVLAHTVLPLPAWLLEGADMAQTILLAMALFALGSSVRLAQLARTGWRATVVGLLSWILIASLAYGAVLVST